MRRSPRLRMAIGAMLVVATTALTGCTHNHYYTGAGQCPPTLVGGGGVVAEPSSSYGAICDVPPGSTVVTTRPPSAAGTVQVPIVSSVDRPKLVTSEPTGVPYNRSSSRFGWRRTDPENIANVKIDGAYDETIK